MALLSPGVEVKETDSSTIIPTVSNSIGVFCGEFTKGPINDRILITNPDDIVSIFGKPTDDTYNQFFQAYNFLQYQNSLYVVRQADAAKYKSSSAGFTDPVLIENQMDFEAKSATLEPKDDLGFIASSAGTWANGIEIAVGKPEDFGTAKSAFTGLSLDGLFEYYPDEDEDLQEIGVVIKHEDVIESFLVSLNPAGKDSQGKNNYIETVINRESNLVYVKAKKNLTVTDLTSYLVDELGGNLKLTGGEMETGISQASLLSAYELFDNKEEIDVDIVIGNEVDSQISAIKLQDFRKDCIAFYGAEYNETVGKKAGEAVQAIETWRKSTFNHNTMFACVQGNYKYQYDRYSDKNRWVNLQGDIQGLRAQTNTSNASWWASAGLERGQIKNVLKLAFVPSMPHRDLLYKYSVNPVTSFPGLGTVMWGQKTLLSKPSSFDRVNVRGLFNTVERQLAEMSRYQVFEFNDDFTRNRIVQMIRPFLETVQAGRGIQDFLVVCDESNNTPDMISRNRLIVDVYIKPNYAAEYITLRFNNQGVNDFSTIVN